MVAPQRVTAAQVTAMPERTMPRTSHAPRACVSPSPAATSTPAAPSDAGVLGEPLSKPAHRRHPRVDLRRGRTPTPSGLPLKDHRLGPEPEVAGGRLSKCGSQKRLKSLPDSLFQSSVTGSIAAWVRSQGLRCDSRDAGPRRGRPDLTVPPPQHADQHRLQRRILLAPRSGARRAHPMAQDPWLKQPPSLADMDTHGTENTHPRGCRGHFRSDPRGGRSLAVLGSLDRHTRSVPWSGGLDMSSRAARAPMRPVVSIRSSVRVRLSG